MVLSAHSVEIVENVDKLNRCAAVAYLLFDSVEMLDLRIFYELFDPDSDNESFIGINRDILSVFEDRDRLFEMFDILVKDLVDSFYCLC